MSRDCGSVWLNDAILSSWNFAENEREKVEKVVKLKEYFVTVSFDLNFYFSLSNQILSSNKKLVNSHQISSFLQEN